MAEPAIRIDQLWKEYRLGGRARMSETLYDVLARGLRAPFRRRSERTRERATQSFWALREVSLDLEPGEVLGVIGRNGAGKSTLLKILTRITEPTRGRIEIRGRVASLLEVGTGFHPELTGRENIYLNGAILGMSRQELHRKFDEIVVFAEIERFLDTPVKRYSSGMYVRLAFAVAAHMEPDVLLVDEVLAVGDAEFQQRCLGKMEQVADAGRTVVFVSHNNAAIRRLCSRGLLLRDGQVAASGRVDEVLACYVGGGEGTPEVLLDSVPRQGSPWRVLRVAARPSAGRLGDRLTATRSSLIEIDVLAEESAKIGVFLHCYDHQHTLVFSSGSFFDPSFEIGALPLGTHRFTCEIPGRLLNDGTYTLDVFLIRNRQEVVVTEAGVLTFRLDDDFEPVPGWQWRPVGIIRPHLSWRRDTPVERLEPR